MISISDAAAMDQALRSPLNPTLKALLRQRMTQLGEYDGYDADELAYYLIVQAGDTLAAVEAELALPVASNIIDGTRYGDPEFSPSWEALEDHGGIFEMVFILSDDGLGWVVLIEDAPGVDPVLLAICRAYAEPAAG